MSDSKKTKPAGMREAGDPKKTSETGMREAGAAKKSAGSGMREAGTEASAGKSGVISAYIKDNHVVGSIVALVIAASIVILLRIFSIIMPTEVISSSMNDTLAKKDFVFASSLPYIFGDVKRGDVVFFKFPDDESQTFVKRVIGLPGETVEIVDGLVYIDGSAAPLDEPYLKETPVGSYGPYTVPEDSYFMLGDNRNASKDSRKWKNPFVKRNKIEAKAVLRWYPFKKFGIVRGAEY